MFSPIDQQADAPKAAPVDVVDHAIEPASQPPLESVRISLTQLVAPPVALDSAFVDLKQSSTVTSSSEAVEIVANNNTVINGEAPKDAESVVVIKIYRTILLIHHR